MKIYKKSAKITDYARKKPAQERSRVLVDALIKTTARILVQDGWQGLTTNRVAREAGVSVGSLYQYFPNKDALVQALVVDLAEQVGDTLVALGKSLAHAPLHEGIDAIVRAALDTSRADAALFRAVLVELPRIGALEAFDRVNRRTADALAEWISLRRDEVDVADPSMTAHVLVTALDSLTDHALIFRPELLESARFERELKKLVAGCLGVSADTRRPLRR
jgi:AcrR family transcriptional regulator